MCNLDGRTFKKPRRPYEKEHLDAELKLVGEYGLRCKRERWRVQYALSRIRNATRMLLTLDEKHPHRIFEGPLRYPHLDTIIPSLVLLNMIRIPFGGGRPGRVKQKNQKYAAKKAVGDDGDEEDE
ncbi:hypothetical protein KY290_000554 [Solanum tuberosum]|uniref:Small ribosomal subunit protein uS4 N-terminal domain-containing protein n=1 Tax=Solanum tuberosum TaxID=4113 RepID=A0ABQ7WJP2_SOLTU|nr:hypothetical protein KY290_000554 [Solanum tuberosum]